VKKTLIIIVAFFLLLLFTDNVSAAATWAETQPARNTNQDWRSIAVSPDGNTAFAAVSSGTNLYKATN
jgi:hypothetical protein